MFKKILILCALLSISACSQMPQKPMPVVVWAQEQKKLQAFDQWQLNGVVGVVVTGADGQKHGQSAQVSWRQQNDHFDIELYGPLGLGAEKLSGTSGSAEVLMKQTLGWSLPVAGLVYWIRGLPAPAQSSRYQLGAHGTMAHLRQAGWDIQYDEFTDAHGLILPTHMVLQRPGLAVTIVIKRWR